MNIAIIFPGLKNGTSRIVLLFPDVPKYDVKSMKGQTNLI